MNYPFHRDIPKSTDLLNCYEVLRLAHSNKEQKAKKKKQIHTYAHTRPHRPFEHILKVKHACYKSSSVKNVICVRGFASVCIPNCFSSKLNIDTRYFFELDSEKKVDEDEKKPYTSDVSKIQSEKKRIEKKISPKEKARHVI